MHRTWAFGSHDSNSVFVIPQTLLFLKVLNDQLVSNSGDGRCWVQQPLPPPLVN